ncbi:MAG: hypothetical protein FJX56_14200 [Alphaproteobacteria bacterium]|nr:hypothetical protein [Alphaproteobacteria bacterium]
MTLSFDTTTSSIGNIRGSKLRPLAVTSERRSPALPDVPTTAEAGFPGVIMTTWYGLFGRNVARAHRALAAGRGARARAAGHEGPHRNACGRARWREIGGIRGLYPRAARAHGQAGQGGGTETPSKCRNAMIFTGSLFDPCPEEEKC